MRIVFQVALLARFSGLGRFRLQVHCFLVGKLGSEPCPKLLEDGPENPFENMFLKTALLNPIREYKMLGRVSGAWSFQPSRRLRGCGGVGRLSSQTCWWLCGVGV